MAEQANPHPESRPQAAPVKLKEKIENNLVVFFLTNFLSLSGVLLFLSYSLSLKFQSS